MDFRVRGIANVHVSYVAVTSHFPDFTVNVGHVTVEIAQDTCSYIHNIGYICHYVFYVKHSFLFPNLVFDLPH